MARLSLLRLGLVTLALLGSRAALADPIQFTGFVSQDFKTTDPNVRVVPVSDNPLNIGQASFISNNGWVSGFSISDIRTRYDAASDTLAVGINTFKNANGVQSIVGDADGNGDAGGADPQTTAAGGLDNPFLGGRKSVAVAFAPDGPSGTSSPGAPLIVAGVPSDKTGLTTNPTSAQDYFSVAKYKGLELGLGYNFGQALSNNNGGLAFDPSAQHPGFEFTIKNFSQIPGLDPTKGFWITAYAGTNEDVVAGEAALQFTRVPAFAGQEIPEPATVVLWSAVALGAAATRRGRRGAAV